MSLISELKRRNVIRMAGLYLIGAWLIAQVAETILPAFDVPNWVMRAIVIVLTLGFVPALVFAWVFELTPGGIKHDVAVEADQLIAPQTAQRMNRMIIALLVVALGYFAFDKFVLAPRREALIITGATPVDSKSVTADPAAATDKTQSIAVLPFVNMSSDKEQDYFSDGLSEELLNQLAQIPQLRVIARTSSFSFKGKEVAVSEIAKALNVANVLEGSVRKDGNTLRITAQLVRTSDSSHLWSQTYDREMTDVFKIQDDISRQVVSALAVKLLQARPVSGLGRTDNMAAYNHYLQAKQMAARGTVESNRQAVVEYQRAIELDPGYVSAHSGMARSYAFLADFQGDRVARLNAMQAADRAIALSPGDPEALAARGWIRVLTRDWQGARSDFEAALAMDPNNADSLYRYAWLQAAMGDVPEAIATAYRSHDLDPLGSGATWVLGATLSAQGRHEEALKLLKGLLAKNPDDVYAMQGLVVEMVLAGKASEVPSAVDAGVQTARLVGQGLAQYSLGNFDASTRAVTQLEKEYSSALAYQIAEIRAWRGEKDLAFQWLQTAIDQNDGGVAMMGYDPLLVSLRDDPRFAAMLKELGLPE